MVSVLLTTYNDARYLPYSIKSILNQTYKTFEFIIIDDGSSDNSNKIIESFNDLRIRHIKISHMGMGESLNYGLSIARYSWIARIDADDIAHPLRLEKQINFLLENKDFLLVSSWYAMFSDSKILYMVDPPSDNLDIKKKLAIHSPICHPGTIFKKEIIAPEGFSNNPFGDYEMWLEIMDKCNFYIIPEILTFVRYRRDSLSRKDIQKKHRLIYEIQKPYYYGDFKNHFGINSKKCELETRGWREYFYGSKKDAFQFWLKLKIGLIVKPRIIFALITLLIPSKYFIQLKELRIKFRLKYFFTYFLSNNRGSREVFNMLINSKPIK